MNCTLKLVALAVASTLTTGSTVTAAATLPAPDGPHAVGLRRAELVDASRRGVLGDSAGQARTLPVIVWYPAERGAPATRPYFNAAEQGTQAAAMARNFRIEAGSLDGLHSVVAHSAENASPKRSGERFPLVIFNHGYECYSLQNTALMERWASHGYIVVSIAHPYDAADLRLNDGRLLATTRGPFSEEAVSAAKKVVRSGTATPEARAAAMKVYAEGVPNTRVGKSDKVWRDDVHFVVRAIEQGRLPAPLREVIDRSQPKRLAITGMSFGGATAVSVCRRVANCRAAINLDGGNQEPASFNVDVGRPMLLMQSDWTRAPGARLDQSPNDHDYERWSEIGNDPAIVRLRIDGIKHMGYTDLIVLMGDSKQRAELFGDVAGPVAVDAIGSATLAFLNQHLKGGDRRALVSVVERTPVLHWHVPSRRAAAPPLAGANPAP